MSASARSYPCRSNICASASVPAVSERSITRRTEATTRAVRSMPATESRPAFVRTNPMSKAPQPMSGRPMTGPQVNHSSIFRRFGPAGEEPAARSWSSRTDNASPIGMPRQWLSLVRLPQRFSAGWCGAQAVSAHAGRGTWRASWGWGVAGGSGLHRGLSRRLPPVSGARRGLGDEERGETKNLQLPLAMVGCGR